jgi:hypothetical protein
MSKMNRVNNRREFLIGSAAAAVGLGCLSAGSKANNVLMNFPVKDDQATHNMLVVGEQTAYLSHLPMFVGLNKKKTDFKTPHRYQVILEAAFTDGNRNLTDVYTADRKKNPAEKMYTFNPALFVLPDLDPAGSSPLRKFRGNALIRGHLERGGTSFIGDFENPPAGGAFDVNVVNVVHFHKFVPGAAKPAQLQYILFGKGPETFLAHFIAAPPDFDQIISVRVTGQQFTDAELSRGIKVTFPGKANTSIGRIKEKQQASGTFLIGGNNPKPLQVDALREFYFEESELFMPPIPGPTAEERRSGFGE